MSYIIQIGQNVRMYSHLFDDERVKNYCMGFFHGKDVGTHAEVPFKRLCYSTLFIVYKVEVHSTPVELPVSITCLSGVERKGFSRGYQ
jgi:hypothetical protein